jgi:hypothetical protein
VTGDPEIGETRIRRGPNVRIADHSETIRKRTVRKDYCNKRPAQDFLTCAFNDTKSKATFENNSAFGLLA